MATNSIFTQDIQNTTQDYFLPKIYNQVIDNNVLGMKMLSKSKKFRGQQFKAGLYVGVNNTVNALGGGFRGTDTFDTSIPEETAQMVFNPKFAYEPINFAATDVSINDNSSDEQVLDYVKTKTEIGVGRLVDNIANYFYSDNTESSTNFSGLRHIISDTGSYGGLSRSTYTVMKPGNTAGDAYDSTTTTLSFSAMATILDAMSEGGNRPDLIVTTPEIFSIFESLITPTFSTNLNPYGKLTRQGRERTGEAGFNYLDYRGTPVVADPKCTAGHMFFIDTSKISFYGMPGFGKAFGYKPINMPTGAVEGLYAEGGETPSNLVWTGFKERDNQAAVTSQVMIAGELINVDPRATGAFTNITA